jgi:xylulokinase
MSGSFLCVDLGTTGLKISILSEDGTELGRASREYRIETPWAGAVEQDPESWWGAFVQCCRELRAKDAAALSSLLGIGICGQMHTQVYLDSEGRPLRSAITWMDQRSGNLVERLEKVPGFSQSVFAETGNNLAPTYTAPNCVWVRENQPDLWRETRSILVAKDYLKYRLSGEMATDPSDAVGTLLFDVAKRRWSDEMTRLFGIGRSLLPDVAPSSAIIGRVTPAAGEESGIPAGTPVNNGSSDNSAAALGCGMVAPGQATLIIGTAGVVSVCSDRPIPDPRHRLACWNYCLDDRWISLGVTQTAGESLNWFKRCFDQGDEGGGSGDIFKEYEQSAADVPPGSGGLVFLPYLNGERTPYWDTCARGVFFGANLETRKRHFIKAVMEGVSFALRNNLETVESLGIQVAEVRATGGGLRSPAWLSCLSMIMRKPIRNISAQDPGNRGNAMLCGMALGAFRSAESALEAFTGDVPDPVMIVESDEACERNYRIFLELYDDLKERFRMAAEWPRR